MNSSGFQAFRHRKSGMTPSKGKGIKGFPAIPVSCLRWPGKIYGIHAWERSSPPAGQGSELCILHSFYIVFTQFQMYDFSIILKFVFFGKSKILKFYQEARKILRIQEKSKIENCLFGMFSSRSYKNTGKTNFLKIFEKINVLASPRQCDFTFSKKSKTIIQAGHLTPKLETSREISDVDELQAV